MQFRGFLIIIALFTVPLIVSGQYGSFGLTDARQLALGNTFASNSRELYAAGKNPAFLACRVSDRKLDILFPNLSIREYNVTQVSNFINDYFSQSKINILSGLDGSLIKKAFEGNGKLFVGLQIGFIGAAYTPGEKIGAFSFVMKDFLTGYLQLPEALVEFANAENPETKGLYFKDFNFYSSWIRSYELSYGKVFRPAAGEGGLELYAGIGVKYIQGFLYNDISFSAGAGYSDDSGIVSGTYMADYLSAASDDIMIDNMFNGEEVIRHVPFMDPVGNGMGIDLGFGLKSERGIKVGFSVTDAGFINWSGKTRKMLVSGIIKIDSSFSLDDIDSLSRLIKIEKVTDNQFQTLPVTALHGGFTFMIDRFVNNFPGEMDLTFEFHQGLAESIINPDFPRVAAALSWKPGKYWPAVLTGISNSLNSTMVWSVGLGYELKFLEIYFAAPNILPVIDGEGFNTLSVSLCWHFVKDKKKKE